METGLPIIAIPTTYAGSEMTSIYGITEGGIKRTGRDPKVLPKTVIYDPDLTVTLPVALSVTSGINAIAHAAEALYAQDANPIISLMSEEGIGALAQAIPAIVGNALDVDARAQALYGAWLCGAALGSVGMSLHHKLCHTLGGSFNLPHASTHTIVLPHVLAYNKWAAPDALRRIARAIKVPDAAAGLYALAKENGAPTALKEIGMKQEDVAKAAEIATADPYWNPRSIERDAIHSLLQDAFDGTCPH
ncbi:hypothetical protein PPGU19_090650 (plasmid) [Paraburkholderia sp. PGU19]|nr:hypothetical protein PPGU19_090650 [Paraburkholderia sp. PGU19]